MKTIEKTLRQLADSGNLRTIPHDTAATGEDVLDLTSNDYLGIAGDVKLRRSFRESLDDEYFMLTASASRLLATHQRQYEELEELLAGLYGKPALLFNSGYHANTGMIAALGDKHTLILADRLVHASIIDGMRLSGARFMRFAHNDYGHLEMLLRKFGGEYARVLIVSESVFSMDGDRSDIAALVASKRLHSNALLYIDEAHAVGVCGPRGLGLAVPYLDDVDILVGTLGKALASQGAYAILSETLLEYMVNAARSLVFSTALPPLSARWSAYVIRRSVDMEDSRRHLESVCRDVASAVNASGLAMHEVSPSHIIPIIIGDAARAVRLSKALKLRGVLCLPIRVPTVPPGTERLRLSLNASISDRDIQHIAEAFAEVAAMQI